ncbi:MAG: putative spermidine/putrescine transport system ATP-binding protein [Actinomycetota bacterium]|nr:putative spermidine/putrescine transport system ATP-binding protein [Actinomycetota bacterium]
MIDVSLQGVRKIFGEFTAVNGIDLDINQGEFFSLLGPSGSGKTTCLRMIAGFEQPTDGRVVLGGRDVSGIPANERDVNTVFQDYALFPHMTVFENVEYGLKVKKVGREERRNRVTESLRTAQLEDLGKRKPSQLSGGQRQRVALARALVNEPRVLLLDEPLGALDLKLRQQMQLELKEIQGRVGLTFIYVTHDQEEALTMSDRLAVLNDGRVEQVGSPADVYERPANAFVAGFVGVSNVVSGPLAARLMGSEGRFTVRPEKIQMVEPDASVEDGWCSAMGRVEQVVYVGSYTRFIVDLDEGGRLVVVQQNSAASSTERSDERGRAVLLVWPREANRILQDEPGKEANGSLGKERD